MLTVAFAINLIVVEHHSVIAVSVGSLLFGFYMWQMAADARRELTSTTRNLELERGR